MRTKHLLFSIALGATFAACSSEENFNVAENNTADAKLSIRPVVDVEIALANDEVNTRFALGTGARPVWSTNDKLGAAVIDVPTYTSYDDYVTKTTGAGAVKPITLYSVLESYGCNNAFSTSDGGKTWASDQPMVEGNYLFYAPYQAGLNFRTPLEVAVPRTQNASGIKTALEEFYNGDNIVQVGYKFITGAEKQRPVVPMYNIFAYPKFTIKNDFNGYLFDVNNTVGNATQAYNGTIKVDSIQLVNISAAGIAKPNMVIGGQLKHASINDKIATDAANTADGDPTSVIQALHQENNGFINDGAWNDLNHMLNAGTKELLNTANTVETGRHNMPGVITTLVVGQDVEYGKSVDIYAVMPAYKFNYNNDMLAAKIYVTIDGVQYVISEGEFAQSGVESQDAEHTKLETVATQGYTFTAKGNAGLSTLTFMAGQSLPAEALYVDGKEYKKKDVGGDLFTIDLKGGQPKKSGTTAGVQIALRTSAVAGTGISSTDELINMIKTEAPNGTAWKQGADGASTKGYIINPINTIEINSALIDALATNNQKSGGSFEIETVVPISNDVEVIATTTASATFKSATGKTYEICFLLCRPKYESLKTYMPHT